MRRQWNMPTGRAVRGGGTARTRDNRRKCRAKADRKLTRQRSPQRVSATELQRRKEGERHRPRYAGRSAARRFLRSTAFIRWLPCCQMEPAAGDIHSWCFTLSRRGRKENGRPTSPSGSATSSTRPTSRTRSGSSRSAHSTPPCWRVRRTLSEHKRKWRN